MSTRLTIFFVALGLLVVGNVGIRLLPKADLSSVECSPPHEQPLVRERPTGGTFEKEYDLSNLLIPREEIHVLLPRDAIPALTDPSRDPVAEADWLGDEARVIAVVSDVGDPTPRNGVGTPDAVATPLSILDWHEIVNLELGGEPLSVTYCPLCDSATVFSRRVVDEVGEEVVLEFGVSGALYNSNVLMYDRQTRSLWSQLGMEAVSGPFAGAKLAMRPVRVTTWREFREAHPQGTVINTDTGHVRNYTHSPYQAYFQHEALLVPVVGVGESLPPKTLGLGVEVEARAWFIPYQVLGDGVELETPAGVVRARATPSGVEVLEAPREARTTQTFYFSWSAFHPDLIVIGQPANGEDQ